MSKPVASQARRGAAREGLTYPFPVPPALGEIMEVAPGIIWVRIPLPFLLDHVNVYLIEDVGGWAIVDTGVSHDRTREVWESLFSGPLAGCRFTKVIVTHFHPDHIGLAGWLCARFEIPLLTSQTGYLGCVNIALDPKALQARAHEDFYRRYGMSDEVAAVVSTQGLYYLSMVDSLPSSFTRLVRGETLVLGGRRFELLTGEGHAPEQIMLYHPETKVLLAADQVIARISPNISIWPAEPEGDPLGLFLRSLEELKDRLPDDTFVLSGHQLPFYGLHARCRELKKHHEERCGLIAQACRTQPMSISDLLPFLFSRKLDAHQTSFAFGEVHAHVNYMVKRGRLGWVEDRGIRKVALGNAIE